MAYKKGECGNPKGRPPVIVPEVQAVIDKSKNDLKIAIVSRLEPKVIDWIDNIIATGMEEGCAQRLKTLYEIIYGRIGEDKSEMNLTPDEKFLILKYRERLLSVDESNPNGSSGRGDSKKKEEELD